MNKSLLLAATLVVALAACGQKEEAKKAAEPAPAPAAAPSQAHAPAHAPIASPKTPLIKQNLNRSAQQEATLQALRGTGNTHDLYATLRDEEIERIGGRHEGRIGEAVDLLDELVLQERFEEFLTLPAYARLA